MAAASAARRKRKQRLSLALLAALAITAGLLARQLHTDSGQAAAGTVHLGQDRLPPTRAHGLHYDRLTDPARTVVRDGSGTVVATLTDGARTAVLTGTDRTFTEPRTTTARLVTDSWVRLMPRTWSAGQERSKWFATWLRTNRGSTKPDVLAVALQYRAGEKPLKDAKGVRYAGAATYGAAGDENPKPEKGQKQEADKAGKTTRPASDFYQYLGLAWTFPDHHTVHPDKESYGTVGPSGYVRLVYGYREGYPLLRRDDKGPGLPRTADAMATVGPGIPVLRGKNAPAALSKLQPGDLVFFAADHSQDHRLDHVGIYLGLDDDGHPRFISSRASAGGPTFGDHGGTARLDGNGLYAQGLRAAKRL
ncbi:NlpC/P60 family protein [Streptomyces sp. NPDC054783]